MLDIFKSPLVFSNWFNAVSKWVIHGCQYILISLGSVGQNILQMWIDYTTKLDKNP